MRFPSMCAVGIQIYVSSIDELVKNLEGYDRLSGAGLPYFGWSCALPFAQNKRGLVQDQKKNMLLFLIGEKQYCEYYIRSATQTV